MSFSESSDTFFASEIINGSPLSAKAWFDFDKKVMEAETCIPFKYKELMAIAVALTTQCPYCLERHVKKAKAFGATQAEIAETIMITAALRSGAALGHGLLTMKLFKEEQG